MDDVRNPGFVDTDLPSGDKHEALQLDGDTMPPAEVALGAVTVNGDPAQDNNSLLSSEETEPTGISDSDLSLVETFLKGPVALGEIRLHLSQLDWTTDDFSAMREGLVKKLESHGVTAGWKKVGQGIGAYYALEITSGSEVIEEAVRQREELRQQEARISRERDMEQVAQLDEKRRENTESMSKEIVTDAMRSPDNINKIVELIRERGVIKVHEICGLIFGSPSLEPVYFQQVVEELQSIREAGIIKHLGYGKYTLGRAVVSNGNNQGKKGREATVTHLDDFR